MNMNAMKVWDAWEEIPELETKIQVIKGWMGEPWCVVLHASDGRGNYGSGKTLALKLKSMEWEIKRILGGQYKFWHIPDLIERAKSILFDDEPGFMRHHPGDQPGLLILDDLGAEANTEFNREFIDHILDKRYRNFSATLIATNLSLTQLSKRYPRATSRMHEGILLEWAAPDFRRR
jgi:DNA replication protein DnaC